MRRPNQGMRFVVPERDEDSVSELRKPAIQEKKKPILLRQLENELRHLDEIDDEDYKNNQDPYLSDGILDRLQMISKEAVKYDLKEIEKLCKLAIGKRILNIELKKKKDEHYSKLKKKEKIELFFRENRIKKYNYDSLIEEKLKENRLIVKAYENGKGFIESTSRYREDYEKALIDSDFVSTIKEVNRLFYRNYSSLQKEDCTLANVLLRIVKIPIIIFCCLAISLPYASFAYEEVLLLILLAIILLVLLGVSVQTFIDRPNNNNQIEQSIEDVRVYFEALNQKYIEKGVAIEWSCSKDFMYLEAIFYNGFPT